MFVLKKLSKEAIPSALEKAERYRLLGEAFEAESICRDVLEAEPDNQKALILLLLSLTDTFRQQLAPSFEEAEDVLKRLEDQYCKAYYGGIICERRAKAHLERGAPGSGKIAYDWFSQAMELYTQALTTCSPGNQDALLRWNTCARIIMRYPEIVSAERETGEQMLE